MKERIDLIIGVLTIVGILGTGFFFVSDLRSDMGLLSNKLENIEKDAEKSKEAIEKLEAKLESNQAAYSTLKEDMRFLSLQVCMANGGTIDYGSLNCTSKTPQISSKKYP